MNAQIDISVRENTVSVTEEMQSLSGDNDNNGATVSFAGTVRRDDGVQTLFIEHYPGMTEKALAEIAASAAKRWRLSAVRITHRTGTMKPGETIVFVGVISPHRQEAFAACEYVVDYLKSRAPFWKRETTAKGERWVQARDSDDTALHRWQE